MAKKRKLTEEEIINLQYREMLRYENLTPFQKFKENTVFMLKTTIVFFTLLFVVFYMMHISGYKPTYDEKDRKRIELMLKNSGLYLDSNGSIQKKEIEK
jgi:hypothetical protein